MVKNLLKTFLKPKMSFSDQKWPLSIAMEGFSLSFTVEYDQFWSKMTTRKRLFKNFYDMNLVRNVQKCSKMRSFKIKRKRGDWKSLKKLGKKFSSGAASSLISQVFKISLLIGQSSVGSTCDQRQSPPIGGNTNRVANRLSEFQMKWK